MAEVSIDIQAMGELVSALDGARSDLTGAATAIKSHLSQVWLGSTARTRTRSTSST
ncbi:hypothetical protein ACVW00_003117 [Marmoricola sp. URHA0025 HA25]